jgi:hypothetical protein
MSHAFAHLTKAKVDFTQQRAFLLDQPPCQTELTLDSLRTYLKERRASAL